MIWGVDPASKSIGLFGHDGYLAQAHKLTVPRSDRGKEVRGLHAQLSHWIKLDANPIVFCEEPVVAGRMNLRSTILIAETVGMVLSLPCPVYLVPVSSWKKGTCGAGNADKAKVAEWLRKEHPDLSSLCGDDQDLVDAASICLYGSAVSSRSVDLSGRGNKEP
jgi:Holliday junction resolvasome RuvABC endonuclease subunit